MSVQQVSSTTTTEAPSITIALPVWNEVASLERLVGRSIATLARIAPETGGEVLIVDDGSTDGSAALADQLAERHAWVRAVHHPINRGYADVQRSCYTHALRDWVFLLPADGQVDPEALFALLREARHADLVVGIPGPGSEPPRWSSRAYHAVVTVLFGWRPWSRLGPCLLVRRSLVNRIQLTARTPVCMTELAARAERAGATVRGVPIELHRRESGKSARRSLYAAIPRVLGELVTLRLRIGLDSMRGVSVLATPHSPAPARATAAVDAGSAG